jgi:hypothetical protein
MSGGSQGGRDENDGISDDGKEEEEMRRIYLGD